MMSSTDRSPAAVSTSLHESLCGLRVEVSSGLVEHEHGRVGERCTVRSLERMSATPPPRHPYRMICVQHVEPERLESLSGVVDDDDEDDDDDDTDDSDDD